MKDRTRPPVYPVPDYLLIVRDFGEDLTLYYPNEDSYDILPDDFRVLLLSMGCDESLSDSAITSILNFHEVILYPGTGKHDIIADGTVDDYDLFSRCTLTEKL